MKTAVYSWRLSTETKAALEHQARRERTSVAKLLDRISRDWLAERRRRLQADEGEQEQLRAAALETVGKIRGGDPRRAENVRQRLLARLALRTPGGRR